MGDCLKGRFAMLKRRSLLLLGCTSILGFSLPLANDANSSQSTPNLDLSSNAQSWMAMHDALIAETEQKLRSDILAGLLDPGTVRMIECPICCFPLTVQVDQNDLHVG